MRHGWVEVHKDSPIHGLLMGAQHLNIIGGGQGIDEFMTLLIADKLSCHDLHIVPED